MAELAKKRIFDLRAFVTDYLGMALALAGLIIYFGIKADNFFTIKTFGTILNQVPDITIVAVGMTFVIIGAGIDLSAEPQLSEQGVQLCCVLRAGSAEPAPSRHRRSSGDDVRTRRG